MKDLKKIITEDYVSFETAKLLKEKGFNEVCRAWYFGEDRVNNSTIIPKDELLFVSDNYYGAKRNKWIGYPNAVTAPTLQMVKKWFKIVHNIGIFPSTYTFSNADGSEEYHPYGCSIIDLKTYQLLTNNIFQKETEEEAVEEAIKFCLKNLI